MTVHQALKWFEQRIPQLCADCLDAYYCGSRGDRAEQCAAYRVAIELLKQRIQSMKG